MRQNPTAGKAFDQQAYRGYLIVARAFGLPGHFVVKDGTTIYASEAPDSFDQCKAAIDCVVGEVSQ